MATQPTQTLKRHPVRGAIWGLVLGIGVALYLVIFSIAALGTLPPLLAIVGFTVLGAVWGAVAPPKQPKSPEPDVRPPTREPVPSDGEVA